MTIGVIENKGAEILLMVFFGKLGDVIDRVISKGGKVAKDTAKVTVKAGINTGKAVVKTAGTATGNCTETDEEKEERLGKGR